MAEGVDNPQEGADVQPTVPEWVPEKFRENPEKFAESYTQLERKLGEQGSKIGEYEQAYGELQQQVEQLTATQQQSQTPDTDALYEAYEQNPIAVVNYMLQQNNQQLMSQFQQQQSQQFQPQYEAQSELLAAQADRVMTDSYTDWGDYKEKVAELIQKDPELLPERSLGSLTGVRSALDRAYRMVKADDLLSRAAEQNVSAVDLARQDKIRAQTLAGAAGRPPAQDEDTAYWERVRNAASGGYASDAA